MYLYVCLCLGVCVCVYIYIVNNLQEGIHSFLLCGFQDRAQVITFGSKHLLLLSHLAHPSLANPRESPLAWTGWVTLRVTLPTGLTQNLVMAGECWVRRCHFEVPGYQSKGNAATVSNIQTKYLLGWGGDFLNILSIYFLSFHMPASVHPLILPGFCLSNAFTKEMFAGPSFVQPPAGPGHRVNTAVTLCLLGLPL